MKSGERRELKHDRFVETLLAMGRLIERHRRPVTAAVLAVVAVAAVGLYVYVQGRAARTERWERLRNAEQDLAVAMNNPDDKQREESVEDALIRLERLCKDFAGTDLALHALYRIAETQYREERYEEAVASYEKLLAHPEAPPRMKKLTRWSLAAALEQLGEWQKAAEIYRGRTNLDGKRDAARAWYDLSRCLERLGRTEEAHRCRRKVMELAPGSPWAQVAELDMRLASESAEEKEAVPSSAQEPPSSGAAQPGQPGSD